MNAWHGLFSQANFVWSHSLDDASDLEDFVPNASQPTNSLNPAAEYGNSNFDIRRRFTWNFSYQLPKYSGSYARLKSGWGIDGVLSISGRPAIQLQLQLRGRLLRRGRRFRSSRPSWAGPLWQCSCQLYRSDVLRRALHLRQHDGRRFGRGQQLPVRQPPLWRSRRNSLRGPSFKEFNFSVFKNTPLTERVSLEIRAEFFNLFNHPNFANPLLPNFIADPA